MCLVVFSYQKDGSFSLAGNRDEFYNRETRRADFWEDIPGLIAGRDLKAGGTWLGLDQKGNIAFLTNFRDPKYFGEAKRSRGELITNFFKAPEEIKEFTKRLKEDSEEYNGFNLIFGNPGRQLFYYSNVSGEFKELNFGLFGISNAYLDTPWPKVESTKRRFKKALNKDSSPERIFKILSDTELANDKSLPDTGIDKRMEKQLSAAFIKMEGYGTRCSTIINMDARGEALFVERTFDSNPDKFKENKFKFLI